MDDFILFLCLQPIYAVRYEVTNRAGGTAGGTRFTNEIGIPYTMQTLDDATTFIWQLFQQTTAADRKNVAAVSMFIEDDNTTSQIAYTSNNEIHFSADFIAKESGNAKMEMTGVIYHELTHVWQWTGNGQAPLGLIEGIADFVRMQAGLGPTPWFGTGTGNRWDEGYSVTARFLVYCNSLKNGFVAELNKKMRGGYSADYFVQLLGKSVDQLWSDYKAKYGN